jgi:hypothetical protein
LVRFGGILRIGIRLIPALFLSSILLLAFQNCTQYRFKSLTDDLPLKYLAAENSGNGGGYEGKPQGSFFRFLPDYTCEGKAAYKDLIVIKGDKILLFENRPNFCAKEPVELKWTDLVLSPFQNDFFTYNNLVYAHQEPSLAQIPDRLTEVVCRDNFTQPKFEIYTLFDINKNTTVTRVSFFGGTGSPSLVEDLSSTRVRSESLVQYSAFSKGLEFEVNFFDPVLGATQLYKGKVTAKSASMSEKIASDQLVCALASDLEPKVKFTGLSDLATPVSLRIVNETLGSWTFTGECNPNLGNVLLAGEALETATPVLCGADGKFSQTVNFQGASPKFALNASPFHMYGFPQVIATQQSAQAMTRIYALRMNIPSSPNPKTTTILYISTPAELQNIPINGNGGDQTRVIFLTADIDLATVSPTNNFTRLAGGDRYDQSGQHFVSTLYGDGHQILNLNVTSGPKTTLSFPGLLGFAAYNVITDLHLRNANVVGTQKEVGILAGFMSSVMARRISITGNVYAHDGGVIPAYSVGGITGISWDSKITQSWFSGSAEGDQEVGGIAGTFWDEALEDSWTSGSIKALSTAGGLTGNLYVGVRDGYIANSYSTSSVTAFGAIGGIIGVIKDFGNPSNPRNSFATGPVTSTTTDVSIDSASGSAIGSNYKNSPNEPNLNITLTNILSLNTALCTNCSSVSQSYSTPQSWLQLNAFAEANWNFANIWVKARDPNSGPPTLRYNPK